MDDDRQIVIPKEQAVFWMDGNGRWRNAHGEFEHKKIIDYFHSAIRKDAGGYYLSQMRNGMLEKVYFRYEDTPLFVFDIIEGTPVTLVLNTRKRIGLDPSRLFIKNDRLFMQWEGECVKFTDRSLMKLAGRIVYADGNYRFQDGDRSHPIAARQR